MNHLRNVWFGSMEKTLSRELNLHLRASLDEIDPRIRVTTSMSAIIRADDKEFSLLANYPKGHGKLFLECLAVHSVFYSGSCRASFFRIRGILWHFWIPLEHTSELKIPDSGIPGILEGRIRNMYVL